MDAVTGIKNLSFDLDKKLMHVEGFAAPSAIIEALEKCGRDGIIRGTGKPNSAAVSILEQFNKQQNESIVKGLARIVSVDDKKTFFDININGVEKPGLYYASVRSCGDVTAGVNSTGDILYEFENPIECSKPSDIGPNLYSGTAFVSAPLQIWELIGRSFVVTSNKNQTNLTDDDISIYGVVARSAGVWQNEKQVCACSGKTLWQERKDALLHNIRF